MALYQETIAKVAGLASSGSYSPRFGESEQLQQRIRTFSKELATRVFELEVTKVSLEEEAHQLRKDLQIHSQEQGKRKSAELSGSLKELSHKNKELQEELQALKALAKDRRLEELMQIAEGEESAEAEEVAGALSSGSRATS